jgi:hypothetical protein
VREWRLWAGRPRVAKRRLRRQSLLEVHQHRGLLPARIKPMLQVGHLPGGEGGCEGGRCSGPRNADPSNCSESHDIAEPWIDGLRPQVRESVTCAMEPDPVGLGASRRLVSHGPSTRRPCFPLPSGCRSPAWMGGKRWDAVVRAGRPKGWPFAGLHVKVASRLSYLFLPHTIRLPAPPPSDPAETLGFFLRVVSGKLRRDLVGLRGHRP